MSLKILNNKRQLGAFCATSFIQILCLCGGARAAAQPDAAKIMSNTLGINVSNDRSKIWGLWPDIWPGFYDGQLDLPYLDRKATLETIVVALVRWAGWDTVNYDRTYEADVLKSVSPEGVPEYRPSPSPRSAPYVEVALNIGLIEKQDLGRLRQVIADGDIVKLSKKALVLKGSASPEAKPSLRLSGLDYPTEEARFAVLMPGFNAYSSLNRLPGRIVDLAGPELRMFNAGSPLSAGRQTYFPLGPLETMLSVGLSVDDKDLSHQSEAIYGVVDNYSHTSNSVGIWGAGVSHRRDARVWGGFLTSENSADANQDAQIIGLEVDVINKNLAGSSPNASKDGIQIVGIGSAPVSSALNIIGAGPAKWTNGILITSNSVSPDGAYIGFAPSDPVARGIDMAGVRFTDSAIALGEWSAITFRNSSGEKAAILSDDSNRLIIRTGKAGLRIVNDKSEFILEITPQGDIVTPRGRLTEVFERLEALEKMAIKKP